MSTPLLSKHIKFGMYIKLISPVIIYARMHAYKILIIITEVKIPLGKSRCRSENNVTIDLKDI